MGFVAQGFLGLRVLGASCWLLVASTTALLGPIYIYIYLYVYIYIYSVVIRCSIPPLRTIPVLEDIHLI